MTDTEYSLRRDYADASEELATLSRSGNVRRIRDAQERVSVAYRKLAEYLRTEKERSS